MPAQLTVSRILPTDLGMRHVDVFIDSVRVGTLNNGQSLTREISPGRHVLKVHNTMVGKTAEFDVGADEHVRFATASRAGFGSSLIWLFGAGPMYVDLERVRAGSHSVVLRLDPSAMKDADIDVRSEIESALRAMTPRLEFFDDGYGFARHSDAMLLSYATDDPDRLVAALKALVERDPAGRGLAAAAMIGVAPREPSAAGAEFARHRLVYPVARANDPFPD